MHVQCGKKLTKVGMMRMSEYYKVGKKLYKAFDFEGTIVVREYEIIHAKKRFGLYPAYSDASGNSTLQQSTLESFRDTSKEAVERFRKGLEYKVAEARKSLESAIAYESLMRDAEVKQISLDSVRAKEAEAIKRRNDGTPIKY